MGPTAALRRKCPSHRPVNCLPVSDSSARRSAARRRRRSAVAPRIRALLLPPPPIASVTAALAAVGGALAAVTAPVWIGIAAGVALVAAAGAALYRYWDRITAVVSGVAEAVGTKLAPVFQSLQPVLDAIRPAIDAMGAAFGTIGDGVAKAWENLKAFLGDFSSLFSQEILSDADKNRISASAFDITNRVIEAFAALPAKTFQVGSQMIQSILDGAMAKVEELLAWLRTLPTRIYEAIGNIDLSNVIKWPSLPSWMGGATPAASNDNKPASVPIDGKRARGGPVGTGKTYLVGEKGPELFTPGLGGMISPNEAYRSAAAAKQLTYGGGGAFQQTLHMTVTVTGVSDPRAAADHAMKQAGEQIKAAVESANTD